MVNENRQQINKCMLDRQAIYQANKQHVWTQLEHESVVLQVDSGMYFSLDNVAGRLWVLLQEPQTFRSLVDSISSEFSVTAEQAESDIESFLKSLLDQRLIAQQEK